MKKGDIEANRVRNMVVGLRYVYLRKVTKKVKLKSRASNRPSLFFKMPVLAINYSFVWVISIGNHVFSRTDGLAISDIR